MKMRCWTPFAALLMAGCTGEFDSFAAKANCTAVTLTPEATITEEHDSKGWVTLREVDSNGQISLSETVYERIAGDVRTSATEVDGGPATIITYDAHQHIETVEVEGQPPIECTNTHSGEVMVQSECGGVVTTYDEDCGIPVSIVDGDFEELITNYIDRCQILSIRSEGVDAAGPFGRASAYELGRPIGSVLVREGATVGRVTEWDCPAE